MTCLTDSALRGLVSRADLVSPSPCTRAPPQPREVVSGSVALGSSPQVLSNFFGSLPYCPLQVNHQTKCPFVNHQNHAAGRPPALAQAGGSWCGHALGMASGAQRGLYFTRVFVELSPVGSGVSTTRPPIPRLGPRQGHLVPFPVGWCRHPRRLPRSFNGNGPPAHPSPDPGTQAPAASTPFSLRAVQSGGSGQRQTGP